MEYLGTSITQPYISNIKIEPADDKREIKVTVAVSMNNGGMSPKLLNTMQTSIVKISEGKAIEKFKSNNKKVIHELVENSQNAGNFGKMDMKTAEVRVSEGNRKEILQEFIVNKNTSDLSFYVICQYNLNHPYHAKKASSNPSYRKKITQMSAIASEDVIRNGDKVTEANVFVLKSPTVPLPRKQKNHMVEQGGQKIWTGPVQLLDPANPSPGGVTGYAAETSPGGQTVALKPVRVPNKTIHDYEIFEQISKIRFNCNLLENKPLNNRKNAQFSNLYITNDKNGFVRLFFAVDLGEIIKNNSKIPRLITNETDYSLALDTSKPGFKEIMGSSVITNIVLIREKVDEFGNISPDTENYNDARQIIAKGAQVGSEIPASKYSVKEDTSIPAELDNKRKVIGLFTEVKGLNLEASNDAYGNLNLLENYRHFAATDVSMKDIKGGQYKYSVKLEIEDGPMSYLKRLLTSLKEGQRAMELYYKDFKAGSLKIDYMKKDRGPWVWAITDLIKTIHMFADLSNDINLGNIRQQIYILSSPKTASAESLSKVVDTYNNVVSHLQDIINEFPSRSKRGEESSNKDTVISGKKTITQSISIDHIFSEIFNAEDNGEVGYDYNDVAFGSKTSEAGMMSFDANVFSKRCEYENYRFFNPGWAAGLLTDNTTYKSELETTGFSYLTPAMIRLPGRIFRTYNTDNKSVGFVKNANEFDHFGALLDVYSYNTRGYITKQSKILAHKTKKNTTAPSIFSPKLSPPANHVKNGLIQNMAHSNTSVLKKYESSCEIKSDKEENTVDKIMPSKTSINYKKEIDLKSTPELLNHEEEGDAINPTGIFAPLFYMSKLNIEKEISCLSKMLNFNEYKLSAAEVRLLPNQLKALFVSSAGTAPSAAKMVRHNWYVNNEISLKNLNNAAFYYLNIKNIVLIEVLETFESGILVSPRWVRITQDHLRRAAGAPNKKLLCRYRPYDSSKICFHKNETLELNVFNEYFIIDTKNYISKEDITIATKRTIKPIEGTTLLDNNELLEIDSKHIKTNMVFGDIAKPQSKPQGKPQGRPAPAASTGGTTGPAISGPSTGMSTPGTGGSY